MSRIAQFLKEYWGVREGSAGKRSLEGQNASQKTIIDIAETLGETERTTKRILKLNDLIPQLQSLVSNGKLGTTAAKELGIESIRVVFEDIPEDDIAKYITETKLSRDDLTKGQKAAIVINLYYEEERKKARERQGERKDISPKMGLSPTAGKVASELAKKAGIGRSSMEYLIAVKRKRTDLYTKVFDGLYSIGKAHAEILSSDLNVITAEINAYQRVAGEAIFEIGRRLKHVKENDLAHGEWLPWLETVSIHERQAQRLIKVFDEFGRNATTWSELPFRTLYEIATLPETEREKPHNLKSGEVKTVDEMTVRELREVKNVMKL